MYVPPPFCSVIPYLSPTEMFEVKLNVDYETPSASEVSWITPVLFFPPCVLEKLLGNVLESSLLEEVFGEFPKFSGCVSMWSRHDDSLVLMWRVTTRLPWCRLRCGAKGKEGRLRRGWGAKDEFKKQMDSRTPSWRACVFVLPYLYITLCGHISHY